MPRLRNPVRQADYVQFNDTMMRIRALEFMATKQFLKGDSTQRLQIANLIKDGVANLQTSLRAINVPQEAFVTPVGLDPGRCDFPYCYSGGTCVLCGFDEIQHQLLPQPT